MKKLLLVMLVPVLVLGIIGCAQGVTETEVDAYIQGAWGSKQTAIAPMPAIGANDDDITLYVSANQMTVKNIVGVSNPFRIEYTYTGVAPHKNRVDVAALAAGGSNWAAGTASASGQVFNVTDGGTNITALFEALGMTSIVVGGPGAAAGATFKTLDEVDAIFKGFFESSIAASLFPAGSGAATVSLNDLTAAASGINALIPVDASEVIIGDLQVYTWESNIDLGKFKTLMVAGASATALHVLKFTPPSGDQWWYKYDNILTKPPVGTYNIKGQM
ncbi:MAG: hypothetical protein FWC19_04180, partial [Treponema sp.]|nr:hypothetical protein [Treponema sp.]